ncbi:glycoside hydrolase family 35 protein [Aspergillus undulatus]|uniref:glycoside hydrolase family 35 protein n=1 Tax=Aspergillus undulatus TaxID=1810928 RepID=UPI003CCDEDA7
MARFYFGLKPFVCYQDWISSALALAPLLYSVHADNATAWPIRDTELGDKTVQWDHYSLIYNGERLFSFGGEFHPFRLPVPEMWPDIIEKIKAMGMNTVSFYSYWGFHALTNDTLDFETGAHNIERIYEIAKELGLFVHARPGPYINAETNSGGMPLWLTTGEYGGLRGNSTAFTDAWGPYINKVGQITAPYQVTENGTDMEEKIPDHVPIEYMKKLFENAQSNGLVVPLTHNMPGQAYKSWSVDYDTVGAGGNVHIYGLDNYPSFSPKQPSMMPEFQGGALNPWDGPPGGCEERTDESFVNFYYRDNVAQRVTILGLYMIHGGTNWGWLAAPFVPSSYGYGAAIAENWTIGSKYYEIKSLALFTRAAKDLTKTDIVGNSTSYSDNVAITIIELGNPDTDAGFYAIRHTDPTSDDEQSLRLWIRTSVGNFTVPIVSGNNRMTLSGHVAKILLTDFRFGGHNLVYSTAEVLTYGIFDTEPTVALWVFNGEGGEFYIDGAESGKTVAGDDPKIQFIQSGKGLAVNFREQEGLTVVETDNGARVLLMDRDRAHLFWAPPLTNDPTVPVDQVAFVQGPHLVRAARLEGEVTSLRGDSNETTTIEVLTARQAATIEWNGKRLKTEKTSWGSLTAEIDEPEKFQDSLAERLTNYPDTGPAWVVAGDTETPSQYDDATKPYLYSDQYGFHTGVHLWRGYFNGSADGAYLEVQGGIAHGWSAWLNGKFIGSFLGDLGSSTGSNEFPFPNGAVTDRKNVHLVVQDTTGHDQGSGSLNVRGIVNATLLNSEPGFTSWKVAGTAGGASDSYLDPLRTHYNEGGLRAERLGWHLPGFDDSRWPEGSPAEGFSDAGVKFYRTHLRLDTPAGHDIALSVKLNPGSEETSNSFRAYLYINGYQYGRYYPYVNADMNSFPAPPGVWNYDRDNVIGLAIWNQEDAEVKCELEVNVDYVLQSALDVKFDGTYLRPGWDEKRLLYA